MRANQLLYCPVEEYQSVSNSFIGTRGQTLQYIVERIRMFRINIPGLRRIFLRDDDHDWGFILRARPQGDLILSSRKA